MTNYETRLHSREWSVICLFTWLSKTLLDYCLLTQLSCGPSLQGIIQKILDIHKVKCVACFGLRLSHSQSGQVHWLHPDMGVSHVREKYEQNRSLEEWR